MAGLQCQGCFFNNKWVIGMKQIQQLEPLGHWIDGLQGAKSEKCAGCRLVCQMGGWRLEVWRSGGLASVPIIQCLQVVVYLGVPPEATQEYQIMGRT